jgi:hypothetical protein
MRSPLIVAPPTPLRSSLASNDIRSGRIAATRRTAGDDGWLLLATIDARCSNAMQQRGHIQRAFVDLVSDRPTSVEFVIDRLNAALCDLAIDGAIDLPLATAFVARFRPALRHVRYASAGHRPIALISEFGHRDLPVTGVPLGRTRRNRFDAIDLRLRDEDALVATTGFAAHERLLSSAVRASRDVDDAGPARSILDALAAGIDAAAVAIVM